MDGKDDDWASALAAFIGRLIIGLVIGVVIGLVAWAVTASSRHQGEPMLGYGVAGLCFVLMMSGLMVLLGLGGITPLWLALGGVIAFLAVLVTLEASGDGKQEEAEDDLHSILGPWR